ncbi:nicotinamide N-methyltransferase Nnt1 [Schizosaccharomyces japonicus yFS275]|uniref:Protein N-terminal and lysine N-methyltransferase EFM7 n=1 Tax=Schizosaccharomyces japonicus (strain yFS275 / FY16936) TaxID=402676 RepID=B6JXW3_SCHJY|nr:nicotinamide N-methyltransferase Nnt1 [Schizosaccharomyces japonicus yFS275]EEB06381.1 nicotinamide N-methyltransferase Nnt1 [Schizosaccharomyces japonicus yFS275]
MSGNDSDFEGFDMFEEPKDFRPPSPPPTMVSHMREHAMSGPKEVLLRLVGNHSLWGHYLWNSGIVLADYIDQHPEVVSGKKVLELGAGAGLPSIIAALNGAKSVVCTDYPDNPLIDNIKYNVQQFPQIVDRTNVRGFLWGADITPLREAAGLPADSGFDVILLSDLVFNHTEHEKLVHTSKEALSKFPDAIVYVFFTHHRPRLAHKDLQFFQIAEQNGFKVKKFLEIKKRPMFENDPGAPEVRATVHGYSMSL